MRSRILTRILAVFAALATCALMAPSASAAANDDPPEPTRQRLASTMAFGQVDCLTELAQRSSEPASIKNPSNLRAQMPTVFTTGCTGGNDDNDNDDDDDTTQIDDGDPVSTSETPDWIVSLDNCGGALIAPRWVVTAAHCIKDHSGKVRIGSNRTWTGGEKIDIESADTVIHPFWFEDTANPEKGYPYDIALLHLKSASTKTPVALAPPVDPVNNQVQFVEDIMIYGYATDTTLSNLTSTSGLFDPQADGVTEDNGEFEPPTGVRVCPGDSGGPGINDENELRAVLFAVPKPAAGDEICNDELAYLIDISQPKVHDWIHEVIYSTAEQRELQRMLYPGQNPAGPQQGFIQALPSYAYGSSASYLADIMAWQEIKSGTTPTSSATWSSDNPQINECPVNAAGDQAISAEAADDIERDHFSPDPDGSWFCENAGNSSLDLIIGAAYQMYEWKTPVVIEYAPGQTFVIRRIDFDIDQSANDDNALAAACNWGSAGYPSVSTNTAISMCSPAASRITPKLIVGRDMATDTTQNYLRRVTYEQFTDEILFPNFTDDILFDPPAAANYSMVHEPAQ